MRGSWVSMRDNEAESPARILITSLNDQVFDWDTVETFM